MDGEVDLEMNVLVDQKMDRLRDGRTGGGRDPEDRCKDG